MMAFRYWSKTLRSLERKIILWLPARSPTAYNKQATTSDFGHYSPESILGEKKAMGWSEWRAAGAQRAGKLHMNRS